MTSLQEALGERLLKCAEVVEEQLNAEIEKLSTLDDDQLEVIRRRRMEELKKKQLQRQEWQQNGHGVYEELPDEKSFFDATKKSDKLVCHFFLPSTERCKIVDMHLKKLAPKHIAARFVSANAEKFPFLTKRLNIRVIPTIAVVIDSQTVDYIRGFDDLGGVDDFATETLEHRLARSGVIECEVPSKVGRGALGKGKSAKPKKTIRGKTDDDSDSDY